MPAFSRRAFLTGPLLVAGCAALPVAARAAAPAAKAQGPGIYRYKLGDFQLTALYDGIWHIPIDDKFVRNASAAAVNEALAAAFLPPSVLPISFTALLVDTGDKLVLIDTGTAGQIADSAGFMNANLDAAGITPGLIDTIVISHFHPDHIDGIKTKDGGKVFANAEILVPEPEWKFWMDDGNMSRATGAVHRYFLNARRIFKDIAKEVRLFQPGAEIVPGIISAWRRGETLAATQALVFLLAAIGIDALGVRRGLKSEYFIFTDPLIILAGAILLDSLSDLRFRKWTYPVAMVLFGLHIAVGQAEPIKYAFKRSGPESIC